MTETSPPLVSILTPSYNQGRFIEDTITSVLRQDYSEIEHIVVDGGSTDETLSILQAHEGRVKYVSEPDEGQADALNKAYARSKGSIIGWLNSDDFYIWDGVVSAAVRVFEEHPETDVAYGHAIWVDAQNRVVKVHPRPHFSPARLRRMGYISQPATFFRRVDGHGLVPTSLHYAIDYALWLRFLDEGRRFRRLESYLAAMRFHPEAKSVRTRTELWREDAEVRAAHAAPRRGLTKSLADLAVMAGMKAMGLVAFRSSALHANRWCVPLALPAPPLRPFCQAGLTGSSGTTLLLPRYLLATRHARSR